MKREGKTRMPAQSAKEPNRLRSKPPLANTSEKTKSPNGNACAAKAKPHPSVADKNP